MSAAATIVRTVEVAVDPATAFEVFTEEIGAWYKGLAHAWNDPERAVGIRFEPGVGGRLLEVWDEATGEGYEMGRILVWEPGERLVLAYRNVTLPPEPLTEVEVRFEPADDGTRVSLVHRGWERLPAEVFTTWASRAWIPFMHAFGDHVARKRGGPHVQERA